MFGEGKRKSCRVGGGKGGRAHIGVRLLHAFRWSTEVHISQILEARNVLSMLILSPRYVKRCWGPVGKHT